MKWLFLGFGACLVLAILYMLGLIVWDLFKQLTYGKY